MEVVETCGGEALSSAQCSFPAIDFDEVVGFEKDAETIIQQLTGRTKELDIISIYGMPGLGKTTLARKVYNNPSIVNHFDVKAWCDVSQVYDRRSLLVDIFKQATKDKSEISEDVDIADKLQKTLKCRRYLIVLDDIWEVDAWEDLRLCFPRGENRSRVMVTTRIEDVAKYLQHRSDPYSLRFLTPEESWELLLRRVFRGESCPPDLLEAGLQVAQHCKGLPLVIVLIAGILMKMGRQPSMWLKVANDLSSYVLGEQSMKVMQSSYDHLEGHLKSCLLYMALFPEDYKIPVKALLMLWMAEEFVLNVDKENMEEACSICLNSLLSRSLVMVSNRSSCGGDITYCILHDVVREFCWKKLNEEKFMQLIVPYNPYQHLYSMESRLSIYIHDDLVKQLDQSEYQLDKIPMLESEETKCFGECPRTLEFIAHPKFNTWNKSSNPLALLEELRLVRALHFPDAKLPSSWRSEIQSLTHLRYLHISVEEFEFEWISHLLNLQSLVVYLSKFIKRTLPAAFWKMTKLRHVDIYKLSLVWEDNDGAIFEESSITMLENLKTFAIKCICVNDRTPRFWWRLPSIQTLSFRVDDLPSYPLFPIVEIHSQLQSLNLVVNCMGSWGSVGWERYFVFPSNLRSLCIAGCFLTEEMILNIARLKKLESLTLKGGFPWHKRKKYHCWDVTNVEFPALKYLGLHGLRMDEWKASEESFPVLEELSIRGGYYFREIPPSFVDIQTMRRIELNDYTFSLVVSAMNIKQEIEENTGNDRLTVSAY